MAASVRRALAITAAVTWAAHSPPARAQDASPIEEARQHYELGIQLYEGERYEEAASELAAAVALDPRTPHLFAWGQALRLSGDCQRARMAYNRVLDQDLPAEKRIRVRELLQSCAAGEDRVTRSPPPLAIAGPGSWLHPTSNQGRSPPPPRVTVVRTAPTSSHPPRRKLPMILGVAAGVSAMATTSLFLLGDRAASRSQNAGTYEIAERQSRRATQFRYTAAGMSVVTAALAATAIVTLARPPERDSSLSVAVTQHALWVGVAGSFESW